jgi:hypothetical protein
MRAVILERNALVARRISRQLSAAGLETAIAADPAQASLDGADVVCADAFDADFVAEKVRANERLRGVLWTAEPIKRALRYLIESPRIVHVLARKDFESAPRAWELAMIARRFAARETPPLAAYLDWGHRAIDLDVRTTADRDHATASIAELAGNLGVPRRMADMIAEVGHELLMNAMYDAPVDAKGAPKYAADRKADLRLDERERPIARVGADGTRLVLQVRDPFGRLERRHVLDGLARGLAGGEQDRSHGGAGLGLAVCHNASTALIFDVARGVHTEVTAVFELDTNLRELRTQGKSLQIWST